MNEQRTLADSPEEPETNETALLYTFSGQDAPVLRGKLNAQQYEQRLSKGEDGLGTVTYGSVESDVSPTALTRQVPDSPAASGLGTAQFETFGSISRSGTSEWAKKHWNDRHEYSQDCTNFVSKALYHGGGMRMKGVGKDRKSTNYWWRTKHSCAQAGRPVQAVVADPVAPRLASVELRYGSESRQTLDLTRDDGVWWLAIGNGDPVKS
ncbi:amidase domain-containing protein [Streptomyces djakartensis]|uniref:amidase domain-containing protein n=1 Tax=Streptomyces djakartensis TaxID=68193 RepID=UPI0034DEFC37